MAAFFAACYGPRETLLLWLAEKVYAERDENGEGSGITFRYAHGNPPRPPRLRVNFGVQVEAEGGAAGGRHGRNPLEEGGLRLFPPGGPR
jgi:hypothetical protein